MTASATRLLDLVCGPASPLPETHQRYRLVAHLGSGGQADVYRAVRLCGGVTSAPLTVKVFRIDPRRPLVDELRSWDKGDAALMDLNNRGVPAICRRADGFYGPPPHRPGHPPAAGDAVPYQVYDYLHGVNLREYVAERAGLAAGARRLNAVTTLSTLATVLRALHHPQETGATPVLHMDVKPSNVMVLATGEVRLIDFTGARYWRPEEITQIAYTPESGGPEAFGGATQVSPAYDVHGFGAVAYFLVTGEYPREPGRQSSGGEEPPPPWSILRRHPMLERLPALRDHLHQPLADRPGDRPLTRNLPEWLEQLADLVRRSGTPDVGVDWGEPETLRVVGRARPRPPVAGTETEAFQRIEKLERELVELRAAVGTPDDLNTRAAAPAPAVLGNGAGGSRGPAAVNGTGPPATRPQTPATRLEPAGLGGPTGENPQVAAPTSPAASRQNGPVPPQIRGRASVPPPKRIDPTDSIMRADEPVEQRERPREAPGIWRKGWELSGIGAFFAFICWGIWAASVRGQLASPLLAFIGVLVVAAGIFVVTRLVGRVILVQRLGRTRRSGKGAHAITGLFLVAVGVAYLQQTPWVIDLYNWLFQQR